MSPAKRYLKIMIWFHVLLGPLGICIMVDDYHHPERWVDWYKNPVFTIPFSLLMEMLIWGGIVTRLRAESRMANGLKRLREALKLQEQGRHDESYAVYLEGCRLTGRTPR